MIDVNDLYRETLEAPLAADGVVYGVAVTSYDVRRIDDVRNLRFTRVYRIVCTHRVVIPNPQPFDPSPSRATSFENYPALLTSALTLAVPDGCDARLIAYAPRTLNATVMSSASQNDGSNQSFSQQQTTGSSVSQTNTYGTSVSLGFFGEDPTGSVGADQSESTTTEVSSSHSTGSEQGASREHSAGDSMSVKDWASYAYLDAASSAPSWVWGQEYPWDVIQYRYCPVDNEVVLPTFVKQRMFDSLTAPTQVFPPSQLSLFGIDVTMKAAWRVGLPAAIAQEALTVEHALSYQSGSHGLTPGRDAPFVRLDPAPAGFRLTSPQLDLTLLGLDPIRSTGPENGAVVGFVANKFVAPPSAGGAFKILSDANTLQVTGEGFDDVMTTRFGNGPVTLTVQFKVVDDLFEYALFLKHWKTTEAGCTLTFVFNGQAEEPVLRHVDTMEAEGGDDNLTVVSLRNKSYAAIEYHDYLVPGLNTIEIEIAPDETGTPTGYLLRALAIGES